MHTKRRARALLSALAAAAALSAGAAHTAAAQTARPKEQPASVSGRVLVGERGAAGVAVALMPANPSGDARAVARTKTDAEGFYRLANVAPGRYSIVASAPAYVVGAGMRMRPGWPPGPVLMLAAGEAVEGYDFPLVRGGVITGRVTDQDGRPVVGETVQLTVAGEDQRDPALPYWTQMWQTDDRGVYRLYGLPAGKYRVSVGVEQNRRFGFGGRERGYYARVYHPQATDPARAEVVEVTEGGEATDIDIKVGTLSRTFKARGRVVYAATGQPAPNVSYAYGAADPRGRFLAGGPSSQTNSRGEFEIVGLMPGRYGVYTFGENRPEYSDAAMFEVTDADVSGVEVRLRPGATLSGVAVIENVSDRALYAQLIRGLTLYPHSEPAPGTLVSPRSERTPVNPDGSFHVTGLRPGRVFFSFSEVRGLSLVRTEVNGAEQRGVEVAEGAGVTGVRLVFAYGSGSVRGQVVAREGEQPVPFPVGVRVSAQARRPGGHHIGRPVEVDSRGRFLIEGLPAGAIEVLVYAFSPNVRAQPGQTVHVTDGTESSVTLTIDLNAPPRPRREQ